MGSLSHSTARGRGALRGAQPQYWGEEGSPTDVPDGTDLSPGGVLALIHYHIAFGIHLHALPWEMAAALAPTLAEMCHQ